MPTFDPEAFVDQPLEAGSTEYQLPPEGEFRFMCPDGPVSSWFRSGESDNGPWTRFEPNLICLDDAVKQELGRDVVTVRYNGGFADLDASTGGLDMGKGKNVRLNQLREAAGVNGKPLSALMNAGPFIGRITHQTGSDGVVRAIVNRVTAG